MRENAQLQFQTDILYFQQKNSTNAITLFALSHYYEKCAQDKALKERFLKALAPDLTVDWFTIYTRGLFFLFLIKVLVLLEKKGDELSSHTGNQTCL